ISYARCASVTGPCTKPRGLPIFTKAGSVLGPGGPSLFTDADGAWWMAYHAWTAPAVGYPAGVRSLRIDKLAFVDGEPELLGPTDTSQPLARAIRLAGADRYGTAAALSAATFVPGVPVVYLTTGVGFADAVVAGAAGAARGGPVLLTSPTGLPGVTAAELGRLQPRQVVIVGGPRSVPAGV